MLTTWNGTELNVNAAARTALTPNNMTADEVAALDSFSVNAYGGIKPGTERDTPALRTLVEYGLVELVTVRSQKFGDFLGREFVRTAKGHDVRTALYHWRKRAA